MARTLLAITILATAFPAWPLGCSTPAKTTPVAVSLSPADADALILVKGIT